MDCARVAGRRHSDPRSKRVSGCTGANSAAGLDLLDFPTIPFYETGTSIYALRQARRRSWRNGQRRNVKVKFLHYAGDLPATHEQETPRLAMEAGSQQTACKAWTTGLMAMQRERVTERGIGESRRRRWGSTRSALSGSDAILQPPAIWISTLVLWVTM